MSVERGLFRILWHHALPATWLGMLGLLGYVLFWPNVMDASDPWPWLFVFVQCLLLAGLLGRFRSPSFAFLYSRGYNRDAIWGHIMLTSLLSIFVAWLPATLIVWTELRSFLLDRVAQNPNFPVMAPLETWIPLVWLALYPLLVSLFHYAWIRSAQPTRGQCSGGLIAIGVLAALLVFADRASMNSLSWGYDYVGRLYGLWFFGLSGVAYIVVLIALALGGRVLHRSLEVRA
jgi:hypothetical protein